MKILMVTMQMCIGGAETHILELCRELHRMGHTLTLASNGGVYADQLEKEGIPQVRLPLHTKKPGAVRQSWQGLARCIREGEFDIVHAHARIPAWICGHLWDHFRRHPVRKNGRTIPLFRFVTTAHLNFSLNPLWRRISRWGERTMSVSEDIAEYLVQEYGCEREHIQTTINGIDMEKFSPTVDFRPTLTKFGLSCGDDRLRLVYMSRLDTDRAAYAFSLIRIALELAEKYPTLDILIVGGGTEEARLRSLAEEANRKAGRPLVTVTGGRSDTNRFTAAADVFVGVSRSALEAMAAGCPVIVAGNQGVLGIFDKTKLRVAMDTNFCCRGCQAYSDAQLMGDIETLLSMRPEERARLGGYCREVVERYYTAGRMAADYVDMYEKAMAAPVSFRGAGDVLLLGYYGFGNMGDESLLRVIADSLAEAVPGVRITALTRNPKRDTGRTGLQCVNRMNLLSIWRQMGQGKLFLSGGGSLLQDVTSGKSLRYYAALLTLAQKRHMKTYVYANGIGPIRREKALRLAAKVLSGCDVVSVRDSDSHRFLLSLGISEDKLYRSADPAFLLTPPEAEKQDSILRRLGLDSLISVSRQHHFPYGDAAGEGTEGYFVLSLRLLAGKRESAGDIRLAEETARFCDAVWEKYRLIPVLVPMQPQTDGRICQMTAGLVKGPCYTAAVETTEEMLSLLQGARLTIGMRLHCLIYASVVGIPMVGLSYDPKIDALMDCLEQPVYPADRVTAEELLRETENLMTREAEICRTIAEKAKELQKLCEQDVRRAAAILRA